MAGADEASPLASAQRRLAQRATSGALWASVESWAQQLLQFAIFIVLARLLGPEAYGLIGIALLVTTTGEMLINRAGWAEALIQRRDLDSADLDSIFWFLAVTTGAFVVIAFTVAGPLAALFAEPEAGRILPWLAWTLPLSALGVVPRALLRRALAFRALALRSIACMLGGGLAGIGMALAGAGVWSLVVQQLAYSAIEVVVLWAAQPWRPGLRFSLERIARIMGFVWGVLGENVLRLIDFAAPRILLGQALGPVLLGHYTLARKVLLLTGQLLVTPLSRVAMPTFAELGHNTETLSRALVRSMETSALVAVPGFLGLALVTPDLVPLLFGAQWTAAVPGIQLALLLGPVLPLTRLCAALLQALGHSRAVAGLAALGTTLLLLLLLVPEPVTLEAVMAAFLVRAYLMLPLQLALVRWLSGVDILRCLRALVPILLASLVMTAAVLILRETMPAEASSGSRLALSMAAGIVAYAAVLMMAARSLLGRTARTLRGALPGAPVRRVV